MIDSSILLPYQKRWIANKSRFKIWEKSRRIGASWAEALNSVLLASQKERGQNTYYVSTDKDNTRQFLSDCVFWIKKLSLVAEKVNEEIIKDEDKDVLIFVIRFASGKVVQSLPTKGEAIRSKQGRVVLDEAAFCQNLKGLVKAATPLLTWGGQVSILSSHNGEKTYFKKLIDLSEERNYYHQKTTLSDALKDGLHKRICLVNSEQWTEEKQDNWELQLRLESGGFAAEEFDCVPRSREEGGLFRREWFEVVDSLPDGRTWGDIRFWDLAATDEAISKNACWTCGVRAQRIEDEIFITNLIRQRYSPKKTDDLILATARQDGKDCWVRWEREPGSAGVRDSAHLNELLWGFDCHGVLSRTSKIQRAKPIARQAAIGKIKILRGAWNPVLFDAIDSFPSAGKDEIDAMCGAISQLPDVEEMGSLYLKFYGHR